MLTHSALVIFGLLPLCLAFTNTEVYNVTLAVYSSAPDPVWTVTLPIGQIIDANTNDPNDLPQRLGYKGFIVQSGKKARLIVGPKTTKLQLQLLDTIPRNLLTTAYVKHIRSEINSGAVKASTSSQRSARNAPPYEPNQWRGIRRICNNCYNYANNKALNNFAQPGFNRPGDIPPNPAHLTQFARRILAAAERDGLTLLGLNGPVPVDPGPGDNRHVVALFAQPGGPDAHWYRLDANGRWSHKLGEAAVCDFDNSHNPITDPRNADRGGFFYQFVAFMYSNPAVTLAGPPNICCRKLFLNAMPCVQGQVN